MTETIEVAEVAHIQVIAGPLGGASFFPNSGTGVLGFVARRATLLTALEGARYELARRPSWPGVVAAIPAGRRVRWTAEGPRSEPDD